MGGNLDVKFYRNGDPIPEVQDHDDWSTLTTGAWCYYDNDPANREIYGKLYNWYAVNDPRGLAPEGWHVPIDNKWKELEMCLGMSQSEADRMNALRGTDEGGKLKSTGTIQDSDGLWYSPNLGATNESGFTALPGGYRSGTNNGAFYDLGYFGYWWSSTEYSSSNAIYRDLFCNIAKSYRSNLNKKDGFSVRCIRD